MDHSNALLRTALTLALIAPASIAFGAPPCVADSPADAIRWQGNGHYYKLVTTSSGLTWTQAQAAATAAGGYLVTITSQAEQNFINSQFGGPTSRPYWIGFTDEVTEGVFLWVTGEVSGYTNWDPGEPSNTGPEMNEDYVIGNSITPTGSWNDVPSWLTLTRYLIEFDPCDCHVDRCPSSAAYLGCVSVTNLGTAIKASFTPRSDLTVERAAERCRFSGFDWVQTINHWPSPSGLFAQASPATPIVVPPGLPFFDPPLGGYTYQFYDLTRWLRVQPNFANAYPFYYSPLDIAFGCAEAPKVGPCFPIRFGNTLNFYDAPKNKCLPGGEFENNLTVCEGLRGATDPFMGFRTQLVGTLPCAPSSSDCNSNGFKPSAPLFEWTWKSDFNGGTRGGVFEVETASVTSPDPGSGTGGTTITSINGAPQTPPSVTCAATPNTVWPPNGKSVLVTVSGTIAPGTQLIPSAGTAYTVIDEYREVQPSGSFALGTGGSYSFGVSLIARRNGDDRDGRTYTVVVGGKDAIGNLGSCSTTVTVPHDQGR